MLDSRPIDDGTRRRRACNECKRRFTTYERLGPTDIKVVKRGERPTEPFEHEKLVRVMRRVSEGRPVRAEDMVRVARDIEAKLIDDRKTTIHSWELADMLLARLAQLDPVMYQRFAADYLDDAGRPRTRPRDDDEVDGSQLGLFGDDEAV